MAAARTCRTRACLAVLMALASVGVQSGFAVCLSLHHEAHVVPLGADHDHEGLPDGGHSDEGASGPCSDDGCCIDLPLQPDSLSPRCFAVPAAPLLALVGGEPTDRSLVLVSQVPSRVPGDRPGEPPAMSRSIPLRI